MCFRGVLALGIREPVYFICSGRQLISASGESKFIGTILVPSSWDSAQFDGRFRYSFSGRGCTWLELAVGRSGDDVNKDPAPLVHMDHFAQRQIGFQPCQRGMAQALIRVRLHHLSRQPGSGSLNNPKGLLPVSS